MLIITRRKEQSLVLTIAGERVEIKIVGVERDRVKLGITAPPAVTVLRHELGLTLASDNLTGK